MTSCWCRRSSWYLRWARPSSTTSIFVAVCIPVVEELTLGQGVHPRIFFMEWFKVGLAAGIVASLVAWLTLMPTAPMMAVV